MDDNEIELLRKLLANKEVKETLKKILLEDEPKKTVKKSVKRSPRATIPKAKDSVKNKKVVDNFKTNVTTVEKNVKKKNIFKDSLSEAIEEEVDGKIINLIEESKIINKKFVKREPRPTKRLAVSKCGQCNNSFEGVGYLCNNCLRGRNAK